MLLEARVMGNNPVKRVLVQGIEIAIPDCPDTCVARLSLHQCNLSKKLPVAKGRLDRLLILAQNLDGSAAYEKHFLALIARPEYVVAGKIDQRMHRQRNVPDQIGSGTFEQRHRLQ